jgi:hypothetical protein
VSCTEAPTCSGDPIQCALLQQQWKTRCPDGPTSAEMLTAIGATEAEQRNEAGPNDATVEVGGVGDGSGFIAAGSCPDGGSFSVMGQTIALDIWGPACQMATLFAPITIALGFFMGGMILFRGGIQ